MIKKWLSRYNSKYLKSLVYMLQVSEYNLREYFSWLRRVIDFKRVMKRKKLILTSKARLLLASLWFFVFISLFIIGLAIWQYSKTQQLLWIGLAIIILIFGFTFFAYLIAIPLWLGQIFIQKPKEYFIVRKAKRKLLQISATKIAIAGSYGKTTIKENLKTLLSEGKKAVATIGNQNTPIGISRFIESLSGGEEVIIFELGEYYVGDIAKLCKIIKPEIGIITGVNEAHLEKFKTLERSANTIFELTDFVKASNLYINAENEISKKRSDEQNHLYSRKGIDNWKVKNVKLDINWTKFDIINRDKILKIKTKLLGSHQIGPLTACIDIADKLGLSSEEILRGIAKIKPFSHRMQPERKTDGSIWIDDTYNGNPDGVKAIIEFLKTQKKYQIIYVTPGLVETGNMNEIIHRNIGKQLAKVADKVILIKNSATPWIAKGLKEGRFKGKIIWFDEAIDCYHSLPNFVSSNDLVVLQNDWPDNYY